MTRYGATGTPAPVKNAFSATRSWATATEAPVGATRVSMASRSSAAAGTFSNSVVTASQSVPSSTSAASSR